MEVPISRDGNGDYTLPSNTTSPATSGTTIDSSDFNEAMDDIETALDESVFTAGTSGSDNVVVRSDGTSGKKVQESGVALDDSNNVSGINNLSLGGYLDITEISAPANPAANGIRFYAVDNGGTTEVIFKDSAGTSYNLTSIAAASGTVTSIDITDPAAGITSSGGPVTSSGSITLALANDLAAVEGLSGSGIAARTASDTWTTRTITAGDGIVVADGDGVSGNPTVSIDWDALSATGGAAEILAGEEGIALDFVSRTYFIEDYDDVLSDSGRIDDLLTVTRASSATYVGRDRLLATASSNTLRYHHDPATGEPLGVLLEGGSTNVFLRSQEIDNASWTKVRSNVTANATTAPDGTTTADKVYDDSTASQTHLFNQSVSGTATNTYSVSFWAKAAEYDEVKIQLDAGGASGFTANFNLTTGVASSTDVTTSGSTASMEQYADGWWRCKATGVPFTSGSTVRCLFYLNNGNTYNGDGASGTYFWGIQLEVLGHASSYIATTTGSASRSADNVSLATSSFPLDPNNMTMYVVGNSQQIPTFEVLSQLYEDANNLIDLRLRATDKIGLRVYNGGASQAETSSTASYSAGNEYQAAASIRDNDFASTLDGESVATDTSGTCPTTLSTFYVGGSSVAVESTYGTIKKVALITRAYSDAEIQALTS